MDAFRTGELAAPLAPFVLISILIHALLAVLLPLAKIEAPPPRPRAELTAPALDSGPVAERGFLLPIGSLRTQVIEIMLPPPPTPPAPEPAPSPEPAPAAPDSRPAPPLEAPAAEVGSGSTAGEEVGAGAGVGTEAEMGTRTGIVVPPLIISMAWPEFPKSVRKQLKIPIVLAVLVNPEGVVEAVELEAPSGCPACEKAAIASAWRLRFMPATRDGVPIAMWTRFPVTFGRR